MKKCALFTALVICCVSASANGAGNLVAPDAASFSDGFQRRQAEIAKGKREVLRELMGWGDRSAENGVAMTFDEWKSLAIEFAGGPSSYYIPDDAALRTTLQMQNAKAERRRR